MINSQLPNTVYIRIVFVCLDLLAGACIINSSKTPEVFFSSLNLLYKPEFRISDGGQKCLILSSLYLTCTLTSNTMHELEMQFLNSMHIHTHTHTHTHTHEIESGLIMANIPVCLIHRYVYIHAYS